MIHAWYNYANVEVVKFMCNLITICPFNFLPSIVHCRRWVSLWQLITLTRYLHRTGCFATRHRFTSIRGTRMGNKRTALILQQADWKWMTQQNTTSFRLSPEWASMGDSILNTSVKCTAYSQRVSPQKRSFVRFFFDVPTILLSSLSCWSQLRNPQRPSVSVRICKVQDSMIVPPIEDRWKCIRKGPGISGVRSAVWKNKDRINGLFHNFLKTIICRRRKNQRITQVKMFIHF